MAATYNLDVGNNDEYQATLTVGSEGSYDYCYRYAVLGGAWVYGDLDGSNNGYSPSQAGTLLVNDTGVEPPPTPRGFALYQNVPNPSNPATLIRYDVPRDGCRVLLRIYDVGGRAIATLVDEVQGAGKKAVVWQGRDDDGREVVSGIYYYRLQAAEFEQTRRLVLLR